MGSAPDPLPEVQPLPQNTFCWGGGRAPRPLVLKLSDCPRPRSPEQRVPPSLAPRFPEEAGLALHGGLAGREGSAPLQVSPGARAPPRGLLGSPWPHAELLRQPRVPSPARPPASNHPAGRWGEGKCSISCKAGRGQLAITGALPFIFKPVPTATPTLHQGVCWLGQAGALQTVGGPQARHAGPIGGQAVGGGGRAHVGKA